MAGQAGPGSEETLETVCKTQDRPAVPSRPALAGTKFIAYEARVLTWRARHFSKINLSLQSRPFYPKKDVPAEET